MKTIEVTEPKIGFRDFAWKVGGNNTLGGIQEGFKGGFCRSTPTPIQAPFLGDSVRILGVCPAVSPTFGAVTPTFGL